MAHSTRLIGTYLAAIAVSLALVGCGGKGDSLPTPTSQAIPTTVPQSTPLPPLPTVEAAGSTGNPLTISLVVEEPSDVEADANALAAALSDESGLSIDVTLTQDPAVALAALCQGQAAAASLDALTYLNAQEANCGDLLYQVEQDGETARQGQIVSLSDRIFTPQNVRDRIFCRNLDDSMIGWVLPALSLRANGVDPFTELGGMVEAADDDEVLADVLDGTCDVGAIRADAQQSLDNPGAIGVILEMASVPGMSFVLSSNLSPEKRAALQDALDGSRAELAAILGGDALVDGDDSAYDGLRDLFTSVGVDGLALSQ